MQLTMAYKMVEPELGADTVQRTVFMPKVQGRVSSRLTFCVDNIMKTIIRKLTFLFLLFVVGNNFAYSETQVEKALTLEFKQIDDFNKAEDGDSDSQLEVGLGFYRQGNYSLASYWLEKAESNGCILAKQALGVMYEKGYFYEQNYTKAMELYRQSAEAGFARSLRSVGVMYREGLGVEKDGKEAMVWFQKAIDAGMPLAYCDMGSLFIDGFGIEQDYEKAVSYFRKGEELGEEWSITSLGLMYLRGTGVKKNPQQALIYFKRAALRGNEVALSHLKEASKTEFNYKLLDKMPTEPEA